MGLYDGVLTLPDEEAFGALSGGAFDQYGSMASPTSPYSIFQQQAFNPFGATEPDLLPYRPQPPINPLAMGLMQAGAGLLSASGPSPYPRSIGSALGEGLRSGLQGYMGAHQANQQAALYNAHTALYNQQARKLAADEEFARQLQGAVSGGRLTPDQLDQMAFNAVLRGHPGAATLTNTAEKLRAQQQNAQAVQSFRSAPGTLGAGVTTSSPQGQALLSNLTGDPAFDASILAAQNEALNSNTRLPPQPVQPPNPGLFGPLLNSPFVGPSAQSLQSQLNTSSGIPAQTWLQHFEKLQGLHSQGTERAAAREDTANLRRELADQSNQTRLDIANMNAALRGNNSQNQQDQRVISNEDRIAAEYDRNPTVKEYQARRQVVVPAANYMQSGRFNSSGDRALAFAYAKMLDPGDRVGVNDIKDINKLGGVPERVVKAVEGLIQGKELPDRVRQEMFGVVSDRFKALHEQQLQVEEEFSDRARRRMLNPSNVVIRYSQGRAAPSAGGWSVIGVERPR